MVGMFTMHDEDEKDDEKPATPGDQELPDDIGTRVGETKTDDSEL